MIGVRGDKYILYTSQLLLNNKDSSFRFILSYLIVEQNDQPRARGNFLAKNYNIHWATDKHSLIKISTPINLTKTKSNIVHMYT